MPIVAAVFMLLLAAQMWQIWRRSPRYSPRSSWLTACASLVAMVLAGLGTLWLTSRLPDDKRHGQALTIALVIALILAVTLGVSAVILRLTDGPMAKTSATAPRIDIHRRKVHRIAWIIGLAVLLVACLDLVPAIGTAAPILACFTALVGAIILYGLHHKALRDGRGVSALLDHHWIHWQYPGAPTHAYLGPEGVLVGDDYTPWALSGTYLVGARLQSPACLVLEFQTMDGLKKKMVPLPQDAGRDVELLQTKLHQVVPRAHLTLL